MNEFKIDGKVKNIQAKDYGQQGKRLFNITLDFETRRGTETILMVSFRDPSFSIGSSILASGVVSGFISKNGGVFNKLIIKDAAEKATTTIVSKKDDEDMPF